MRTLKSPVIEQWMRDVEREWQLGGIPLPKCIAKHAPAQPAELPSIWKPVSQRPTKEDRDNDGWVIWCSHTLGMLKAFRYDVQPDWATHWCRTADLLPRCPLPKVKTQGGVGRGVAFQQDAKQPAPHMDDFKHARRHRLRSRHRQHGGGEMSAPDKTGGPAFPRTGYEFSRTDNSATDTMPQDGMTLRDWYLGQILAGMWASRTHEPFKSFPSDQEHACMVKHAMRSADLAIAAREAKP